MSRLEKARRLFIREDGASLIEFSIVITLFLLIFFAMLDFGRLGFNWVMTEKAMHTSARIAAVRPPLCSSLPDVHSRATGADPVQYRYGSLCRDGACKAETTRTCTLAADGGDPLLGASFDVSSCGTAPASTTSQAYRTAFEIYCTIHPILPSNAGPEHVQISYSFDPNLGFLGGPYTPSVEAAVVTSGDDKLYFQFITPLGGLAGLLGGSITTIDSDNRLAFPDLGVSMPGEDLNQGVNG